LLHAVQNAIQEVREEIPGLKSIRAHGPSLPSIGEFKMYSPVIIEMEANGVLFEAEFYDEPQLL
jgi:hypothetical protein